MANDQVRKLESRPSMMLVITLLGLILAAELGLPILLYLMRDRLMFLPSTTPSPEAGLQIANGATRIEIVRIQRADGRLLATYDAQPHDRPDDQDPLLIYFHGNAGNIGLRAPWLDGFSHQTSLRTVLPDYSGYGGNSGKPSESEVYKDGLAVFDHFVASGILPHRIVLYGESLGGAVALYVATQRNCGGLILQSTFSSVSSMARRLYPWLPLSAVLTRGLFPSNERIATLTNPMLIVHGSSDRVIPFSEGLKLHRAAPRHAEFLAVDGAGHNDFYAVAGRDYLRLLVSRVEQWTAPSSPVDNRD